VNTTVYITLYTIILEYMYTVYNFMHQYVVSLLFIVRYSYGIQYTTVYITLYTIIIEYMYIVYNCTHQHVVLSLCIVTYSSCIQ